jgi:hypothetical protein
LGVLLSLCATAQTFDDKEPELSANQAAIVNHKIAMLKSSADRQVAKSWSNAKKVAELLCRPVALPILKKQAPGADKVFLGTEASSSLNLESNDRLLGSGQVRTPNGWQDFSFTCELNPNTGKVTSFKPVLSSK